MGFCGKSTFQCINHDLYSNDYFTNATLYNSVFPIVRKLRIKLFKGTVVWLVLFQSSDVQQNFKSATSFLLRVPLQCNDCQHNSRYSILLG